jgi:putative endonuclease
VITKCAPNVALPQTKPIGEVRQAKWGYNFMVYYTYILRLNNGKYYIGHSTDLKSRFKEHCNRRVFATKNFIPCVLVFYAAFISIDLAIHFEKYLKTSSGFAFRNKHLIDVS